jgi:hypothetical protein
MARSISPTSVASRVGVLKLEESLLLENPYTSVMVMVSQLKKKEEHKQKLFKIKYANNITTVTRIK